MEQIKGIKSLEEERIVLHHVEMDIDDRCDKVIMSLVNNITIYVMMMMGVVFVCVVLLSSKRTLYSLLGMMTMLFFTGVGLSTFMAFIKLKKIQPMMNEIKRRKEKLKKVVGDMHDQLNKAYGGVDTSPSETMRFARTRVALVEDALQHESGAFKEDYIKYLMWICMASLVYPLSIISWTFFMHTA